MSIVCPVGSDKMSIVCQDGSRCVPCAVPRWREVGMREGQSVHCVASWLGQDVHCVPRWLTVCPLLGAKMARGWGERGTKCPLCAQLARTRCPLCAKMAHGVSPRWREVGVREGQGVHCVPRWLTVCPLLGAKMARGWGERGTRCPLCAQLARTRCPLCAKMARTRCPLCAKMAHGVSPARCQDGAIGVREGQGVHCVPSWLGQGVHCVPRWLTVCPLLGAKMARGWGERGTKCPLCAQLARTRCPVCAKMAHVVSLARCQDGARLG